MAKAIPISEVKARLPELVSGIEKRVEEIVVTRNGKPAAVLLNYDEYERLKETLHLQQALRALSADPFVGRLL